MKLEYHSNSTQAHEARVPLGFQQHLKHTNFQTLDLTLSLPITWTYKPHSQCFWTKKKRKKKKLSLLLSLTSAAEDFRRRRPLSLISLTVFALNHSVRLQRLSFPSPSLRSKVLSLSLSLSIVKRCCLELITAFVLLITNDCNFMKKKIPLKVGVCKFCIFMHKLILGFDPGIN